MSATRPGAAARGARRILAGVSAGRLKGAALRISDWFAYPRISQPLETPAGAGRALSTGAVQIDPASIFSPDRSALEARTRFDQADTQNIEWMKDERAFYRGIPYSKYLGEWQFHPGRIGGYLTTAKLTPKVIKAARKLREYMIELPNGGLAVYYPSTIRTSRFTTNEPLYSGIAQGQLLAGYTRLIREAPGRGGGQNWHEIAARLVSSMRFPVERGGVAVDDRMILEAPNFRACPESILNGWADALLHLYDYLQVAPDPAVETFYRSNIEALIGLLPTFDALDAHLSRYSNLCPYTFRVNYAGRLARQPNVRVEYLSTAPGFRDCCIPSLWSDRSQPGCVYDNKVLRSGASSMDIALSVSGQFDLRVEIEAECASISFDPGTFDETSTVPARTFKRRFVAPAIPYDGRATSFYIQPREYGLIAGCPTNFMKKGRENFYHSYHVTALYELALTTRDPRQRKMLTDYAALWHSYIGDAQHRARAPRFVFAEPAMFVRSLNTLRALRQPKSFEELQATATAF